MTHFPEMNDRTFITERQQMAIENVTSEERDAQIAADHAAEMAKLQKRYDLSAALHEFILDRRTCPVKGYRI